MLVLGSTSTLTKQSSSESSSEEDDPIPTSHNRSNSGYSKLERLMKWNIKFSEEGDQSINSFIQRFEEMARDRGV